MVKVILKELKVGNNIVHKRYGVSEIREILYSKGSFFGMVISPKTDEGRKLLQCDTGTDIPDVLEDSLRLLNPEPCPFKTSPSCPKVTVLKVVCAWCGKYLYEKDSKGAEGVSHGICAECKVKIEKEIDELCPFRTRPVIKYLGRPVSAELISCPTCGRTRLRDEETGEPTPFYEWCNRVDQAIRHIKRPLKVAVMGCEVNGPGEARDADIGIALGKGRAALFRHGEIISTVPVNEALDWLLKEVERTW